MKQKKLVALVVGVLLLNMLIGCGAPATNAPGPVDAPTTEAEAAPTQVEAAPTQAEAAPTQAEAAPTEEAEAKVLRLLWWQAPTILNPFLSHGVKDGDANTLVLEPLAYYDANDQLVPILADEIPTVENGGVSEDYTTITWKLKKDVKWSDGTDFTAEDCAFTWDYVANPDVASAEAVSFREMETVEILDPYTIKVTFSKTNPNIYMAFTAKIIQKAQFEDYNGPNANEAPGNLAPVGTGPFRVVSFVPGDVGVYERNPYYRDADNVYFDQVIMKGGGDSVSAARAVMQTGDYDFAGMLAIERDVLENLESNATVGRLATYPGSYTQRIMFNHANPDPALGDMRSEPGTKHPFLSDVRVRRALAMAIDRELIAERLWGISGNPTCSVVSHMEALKSTKHAWGTCPYDIEAAKALLDEAGWVDTNGNGIRDKDGVEMEILFQTAANTLNQKTQEIVKAGWEELGASVELRAIDASIHHASDPGNPDTLFKFYADVQMVGNGISAGSAAVIRYMTFWISSEMSSKENGWGGRNIERFSNPEFDAMYEQLAVMTDEEARNELAIKMADLLADEQSNVPLVLKNNVVAMSNDLKGVEFAVNSPVTWNIGEWYK